MRLPKFLTQSPRSFFREGMPSARKDREERSQRNLIAFDFGVLEQRLGKELCGPMFFLCFSSVLEFFMRASRACICVPKASLQENQREIFTGIPVSRTAYNHEMCRERAAMTTQTGHDHNLSGRNWHANVNL